MVQNSPKTEKTKNFYPAKSAQIPRKSTQISAKVRKSGFLHCCILGYVGILPKISLRGLAMQDHAGAFRNGRKDQCSLICSDVVDLAIMHWICKVPAFNTYLPSIRWLDGSKRKLLALCNQVKLLLRACL